MAQVSAKELFRNIGRIPPGERLLTFMMFLWFFITICSYYVLRPVRSSLFLTDYGPYQLPWVYMGTALATGVVVYLFAKAAGLPRKWLISGVILIFASNLFAWWWIANQAQAAREAGGTAWGWSSPAFYVWTDIFSIMAVTIFWMYANDVFAPSSAKRVFGVIGTAGPAGGITGAWLVDNFVTRLGTEDMILVSAVVYSSVLVIFLITEYLTRGRSAATRGGATKEDANLSELPAVLRLIRSSRFLLLLTFVVCLERMVPDFGDFIFQTIAKAAFPDKDAYTDFFARVEFIRNIAAFVAALFFTAVILNLLGVKFALAAVPTTILVFAMAFLLMPVLLVAVLLKNVEEGQRHSWFKAAKETTYTVTSREVIYRVKGYIEMFFYRLSRGLAGFVILLIVTVAGLGPRAVAAAALPLAAAWLYCAWNLGKEYQKREAEIESGRATRETVEAQPQPAS